MRDPPAFHHLAVIGSLIPRNCWRQSRRWKDMISLWRTGEAVPYGDVDVDYYHYIIITTKSTNVGKTIINQPWLGMATYHIYWWWWLGDGLWHIVLPTWSILILAQVTITLVCRSPYSTQEISTMASMFSVPGLFGLSENTKAAANLVVYHVFSLNTWQHY